MTCMTQNLTLYSMIPPPRPLWPITSPANSPPSPPQPLYPTHPLPSRAATSTTAQSHSPTPLWSAGVQMNSTNRSCHSQPTTMQSTQWQPGWATPAVQQKESYSAGVRITMGRLILRTCLVYIGLGLGWSTPVQSKLWILG